MAGVRIEEETAVWLIDQVSAYERGVVPGTDLARRRAVRGRGRAELFEARVTSVTLDTGNYPAVITRLTDDGVTWEDFDEVRVKTLNGETLVSGRRYPVRPAQDETASGYRLYSVAESNPFTGAAVGFQVRETSGGAVVAVVTDVIIGTAAGSNNGGLRVVAMGGGSPNTCRIYSDWATATDYGIVTPIAQEFGGTKTFVAAGGIWVRDVVNFFDSALDNTGLVGQWGSGLPDAAEETLLSIDPVSGGVVGIYVDSRNNRIVIQNEVAPIAPPGIKIRTGATTYVDGVTGTFDGVEYTSGWRTGGALALTGATLRGGTY